MKTQYPNLNITLTVDGISIDVLNIISERFTKTIPVHSHGSNCYEIHYIPYGYGTLNANGITYNITPNTLYITGPHIEHAQFPDESNPMVEYCVYLRLHKTGPDKKLPTLIKNFTARDFWFGSDSQDIGNTLKQLFNELENQYICYTNQVEALLITLLIQICRNYEQSNLKKNNEQFTSLTTSDNKSRIIEEYFLFEYNSLSLTTLSQRLNLSPRQTQRLLHEYYGKSFQEKKAEARMSAAAILLKDSAKNISEISQMLGFSSPEHFSSAFHKHYNISPRDFRKSTDNL